jgi:hypothetical protein
VEARCGATTAACRAWAAHRARAGCALGDHRVELVEHGAEWPHDRANLQGSAGQKLHMAVAVRPYELRETCETSDTTREIQRPFLNGDG